MQTSCAGAAPEGNSSSCGDCAACESELMCTLGAGPPLLYISWAVSGTLAKLQASGCPLALPRQDAMLGRHHPAWGECKMPQGSRSRGALNIQILRFGCRKAGSARETRLAIMG